MVLTSHSTQQNILLNKFKFSETKKDLIDIREINLKARMIISHQKKVTGRSINPHFVQ